MADPSWNPSKQQPTPMNPPPPAYDANAHVNQSYPQQPNYQQANQAPSLVSESTFQDAQRWVPANRMDRFRQLCQQYEISDFFAAKLRALAGFEIVLIADDSGSMQTPIAGANAFAPMHTRWDELKNSVSLIVSIAALFDENGLDLYFLNRPPVSNIHDPAQLAPHFAAKPAGFTPIAATLQAVFQAKQAVMAEKKLLVIILTDGEPTDRNGQVNIGELEQVLTRRHPQSYITFVACTDDLSVMNYLNGWDVRIPRLDVVDDYQSEKREVQNARGASFRFSYGDYVVKLLLGTIDPQMDQLDEPGPGFSRGTTPGAHLAAVAQQQGQIAAPKQQTACCVIS